MRSGGEGWSGRLGTWRLANGGQGRGGAALVSRLSTESDSGRAQ